MFSIGDAVSASWGVSPAQGGEPLIQGVMARAQEGDGQVQVGDAEDTGGDGQGTGGDGQGTNIRGYKIKIKMDKKRGSFFLFSFILIPAP